MSQLIALLTDFGTEDHYVGVMKAVIMSIDPIARIVDITHAVRPQNVRQAAFTLLNSYRYFPEGTVFQVVVDPGVGSTRIPVAVKAGGYSFVAPDNGVLSYTLSQFEEYQAVMLENRFYQLPHISHTFHGRDIFSPASAYLASGRIALAELGPRIEKLSSLAQPDLSVQTDNVSGEIVHIDHFGNLITSIGLMKWEDETEVLLLPCFGENRAKKWSFHADSALVTLHDHNIEGIGHAYHEVQRGDVIAQIDSNGFLEIAINQDHAAKRLNAHVGDRVILTIHPGE